jgi:hypothetical protein
MAAKVNNVGTICRQLMGIGVILGTGIIMVDGKQK